MRKALSALLVLALLLSMTFGGTVFAATSESIAVTDATPTKSGSLFAGWYEDAAMTTPYRAKPEAATAYAKWVDAKALTVKYQITDGTNEGSSITNLRVVTTVDNLNYQKLGFKVEYGTHTGADAVIRTTTQVADTLSGFSGAAEFTYTPAEAFENTDSAYFCAWNFKLPTSMFDMDLTVTAFWDTLDGTRVFGAPRVITVSDTPNYNEILIGTAAELTQFATDSQTKNYANWKVRLTADIDLNPGWTANATAPTNTWTTPIGSTSLPFAGLFDGQGHTISGVYQSTAGAGLFKQTASTAVLRDFRLENSYFNTTDGIAGCLAAKFAGTAERIYNNATLNRSNGNNYFGGFFGQTLSGALISECWFDGTLILSNGQRDGGFIGAVVGDTTIEHSLFSGTLSGGYAYMGGIAGIAGTGTAMTLTVNDCLAAAVNNIIGNSSTGVASLVGSRETANDTINFTHTVVISNLTTRTTAGSYGWTNSENYAPRSNYDEFSGFTPSKDLTAFLDFDSYWVRRAGKVPAPKNLVAGSESYTVDEQGHKVFTISTAAELKDFAAASQSFDYEDCIVKLAADIDLNPGCTAGSEGMSGSPEDWTPIGSTSVPFAGTFDGQGHTISGLFMRTDVSRAGLFMKTTTAAVLKDFRLENGFIGTTVAYAGSVAGSFAGTAEKIYSNVTVRKTTSGNSRFGGFFGNIEGATATISDCWYDGLCSADGNSYVGGFIGALDSACSVTVERCLFTGALVGSQQTGGICGNAVTAGSNITITQTLTASPSLTVSQYGGLVGGRQTANSTLTANNSVCVCSSKWYGNSGAYSGNAVNVSSKTVAELKGANGIFLATWLDFDNVFTLREGEVPGLQIFCETAPGAKAMVISTAAGLKDLASVTKNYSFTGWTVKLAADIDLNPGCTASATAMSGSPEAFAMIGSSGNPFGGTFDGQGHTISGAYVAATSASGVGLFHATASTATIKNLKVTNSLFTTTAAYGGGVVCFFAGRMEKVFCDANVYKSTSGNSRFGGLAATVQGGTATFSECWFAGTVKADGNLYVGGLVGGSENSAGAMLFEHCLFTGSMSCGGQGGGIFGYMLAGGIEFNDTLSIGTITTGTASSTGTLFGGRSSATPQLVVRDSAGVGAFNFLGASAADTLDNADGITSRSRDELKGIDGVFLDKWLDFENYWMLRDNDVPALRCFFESTSALQSNVENWAGVTASSAELSALNSVYSGTTLYQGDMHAHADDDGKLDETTALAQWKTEMAGHDLDFVASLDHKQTSHIDNSEWDKDLFLYGTEPGTYISGLAAPAYSSTEGKMHYLMLFKTKGELENVLNAFPSFNYDPTYTGNCTPSSGAYDYPEFTKTQLASLASAVKANGGLFVFAHPYAYDYSTAAEDYFIADGTALELIYGSMSMKGDSGDSYTKQAYDLWKELLAAGHKVYVTSGSDIHGGLDTQDDHSTNPQKAEKALISVYAVTDTAATNKADLIMDRLVTGNFSAGSVGIKMAIGNTPMGGTTSFSGKKLVVKIENGAFHQYVDKNGHAFRVDVYTDAGLVFSKHITNTAEASFSLAADDSAAFYRVVVIDETDNRPISYGNPIWND